MYQDACTQYLECQHYAAAGTGIGFRRLLQTHAANCSPAGAFHPFGAMSYGMGREGKYITFHRLSNQPTSFAQFSISFI